jgi:eukaryotic-like serine/threonine-protein kinase
VNTSLDRLAAALADRYRIERELGAGGMATVYLAEDLKHRRSVAVKVLKPELAAVLGADRFVQEITTTAALQHPHILPLFDSGEADGFLFYVMPFIDGETLRAKLDRETQLGVPEAVRIATEVADALHYAHQKGVIHRDIKPENILLANGRPMVADFGIALAVSAAAGGRMTETGLSLGTPHYMSPEQATAAREITGRSDVYSLASVLYEMLTGNPPHTGASAQQIIMKIITEQAADVTSLRKSVPANVAAAVSQALEKLPADRFASAAEFAAALADRGFGAEAAAGTAAGTGRSWKGWLREPQSWAALIVIVVLAGAAFLPGGPGASNERWAAYTQLTDASGEESSPRLSPDGESFAYASNVRGSWDIYVQRVGGRNSILVAGDSTLDEQSPAYSPDGRQIAYSVEAGGIFVVGATGESPRRVTSFGADPAWSPDGQRLVFGAEGVVSPYAVNSAGQLWIADVAGGAPVFLLGEPRNPVYQPAWSPSGRRIAFWVVRRGQRDIATVAASGGDLVLVTDDGAVDWAPTWSPDGRHLYFASDRGGTMGLWRIGIDEPSGRPRGAPELVAAGVDVAMDLPQLSRDGSTIIFRARLESVNPASIAFDPVTERVGPVALLQQRSGLLVPSDVSPDGAWLALFSPLERQQDLFLMRRDGRDLTRLTDDVARDWYPRFTPDGEAVTFYSNQLSTFQSWLIRRDGSGRTRLSDFGEDRTYFPVFAPDGERLLIVTADSLVSHIGAAPWPVTPETATRLTGMDLPGGRLYASRWSPDGRWLTGMVQPPSGASRGIAIYELATSHARLLSDDGLSEILAWLPGSGRVVYFTRSGALVVQDVGTLERRVVSQGLAYPPDEFGSIVASPDGRTLFYGARQVESNIWVVRRAAAGRAP